MYDKTTAPQRHMLLSAEENVVSCDFDMDCTDDSEGLTHSCQEISMDIDMEERSTWILPLRTLMDADKDLTVESNKKQLFPYLNGNLLERELASHDLRRLEVLTDAA